MAFVVTPIGTNGKKQLAFFHPTKLTSSSCNPPEISNPDTENRWNFPTYPNTLLPRFKTKSTIAHIHGIFPVSLTSRFVVGQVMSQEGPHIFFHWVGMAWEEGSFSRCGERRFDGTVVSWGMILKLDIRYMTSLDETLTPMISYQVFHQDQGTNKLWSRECMDPCVFQREAPQHWCQ